MNHSLSVSKDAASAPKEGYMEAMLRRLQDDVEGRKKRRREFGPFMKAGAAILFTALLAHELGARSVNTEAGWLARAEARASVASLRSDLDASMGQIDIQSARLERLETAYDLSTRYQIPADLALSIREIAMAEGIDPNIAFELVRVESGFNQRAVSPVGALGLTQLMPATARILSPGISRQEIFERETNLRLGFRFFNAMLKQYDGDVRLALLAYNRGPATVDRILSRGEDPSNGYARAIMGSGD